MSGSIKKQEGGAEGPVTPNEELMSVLGNMGVTSENAAKASVFPCSRVVAIKGQKKATASCHTPNRVYTK